MSVKFSAGAAPISQVLPTGIKIIFSHHLQTLIVQPIFLLKHAMEEGKQEKKT